MKTLNDEILKKIIRESFLIMRDNKEKTTKKAYVKEIATNIEEILKNENNYEENE